MTPSGKTEILPAFIDSDGTLVVINPPGASDVGIYSIKICSQLDNSLSTEECFEFDLTVEPLNSANITVSLMPDWLV